MPVKIDCTRVTLLLSPFGVCSRAAVPAFEFRWLCEAMFFRIMSNRLRIPMQTGGPDQRFN